MVLNCIQYIQMLPIHSLTFVTLVTVYADGSIDSGAKATLRYYLANEEELEIFSTLENKGMGL